MSIFVSQAYKPIVSLRNKYGNKELKLRRIFPALYFANTNLPEGRSQIFLKKTFENYQAIAQNVFMKSNIERYMERPSATFWNGKYSFSAMISVLL